MCVCVCLGAFVGLPRAIQECNYGRNHIMTHMFTLNRCVRRRRWEEDWGGVSVGSGDSVEARIISRVSGMKGGEM